MKQRNAQTHLLHNPPSVRGWASTVGKKESAGPLGGSFDLEETDSYFGQKTWEQAESKMVSLTIERALQKSALSPVEIDCAFGGDLLNQCVGATFGVRDFGMPYCGLYGACSTMAEGTMLASMLLESGHPKKVLALASSHFCTAERQFRFPLEYGSVRTPTAQWTATASGVVILEQGTQAPFVRGVTIGTIVDPGLTDINNMGAAMAPAAAETIAAFFRDTGHQPADFDAVVTGDLGAVGSALLCELLERQGILLRDRHQDCGLLLFNREKQDVRAGGSGCGCSAAVLCGHFLPKLREGSLRNILFLSTGALMSPTTVQQQETIPGIAHLLWLSHEKGENHG